MVSTGRKFLSIQLFHFLYIRISKYTHKQKQEEKDIKQECPNPFSLRMGVDIAVSTTVGILKICHQNTFSGGDTVQLAEFVCMHVTLDFIPSVYITIYDDTH